MNETVYIQLKYSNHMNVTQLTVQCDLPTPCLIGADFNSNYLTLPSSVKHMQCG